MKGFIKILTALLVGSLAWSSAALAQESDTAYATASYSIGGSTELTVLGGVSGLQLAETAELDLCDARGRIEGGYNMGPLMGEIDTFLVVGYMPVTCEFHVAKSADLEEAQTQVDNGELASVYDHAEVKSWKLDANVFPVGLSLKWNRVIATGAILIPSGSFTSESGESRTLNNDVSYKLGGQFKISDRMGVNFDYSTLSVHDKQNLKLDSSTMAVGLSIWM